MQVCSGVDLIQERYGFFEVAALDDHDDVDGIEVLLATEASCEVGLRIGSGVELGTDGAEESEVPL
jgi:hypothetical protein